MSKINGFVLINSLRLTYFDWHQPYYKNRMIKTSLSVSKARHHLMPLLYQ